MKAEKKTVTLYGISDPLFRGRAPELESTEAIERKSDYLCSDRPDFNHYRVIAPKSELGVSFALSPREAWEAYRERKREAVAQLAESIKYAEECIALADAELAMLDA